MPSCTRQRSSCGTLCSNTFKSLLALLSGLLADSQQDFLNRLTSHLDVADGSACSSRHLFGVPCFGSADRPMAAGKIAGRYDCAGLLSGRTAEQCSSPPSRAFYRRGVVNWQYVLDLDDSGWSELPIADRPLTRQPNRPKRKRHIGSTKGGFARPQRTVKK